MVDLNMILASAVIEARTTPLMLLKLDLEKALDRISRRFILRVVEWFLVDMHFLAALQAILSEPTFAFRDDLAVVSARGFGKAVHCHPFCSFLVRKCS